MPVYKGPAELPEDFAGIVRLFPLPNLVLFPHVVQGLHIFEPRYRALLEDALAGDQLIAMALLEPDWESQYEGRPPIYPVTCVGRVMAHSRLEDGRYNILLHGLRRATVVREFPPEHVFRLAEVAIMEDFYAAGGEVRRSEMQRDLLHAFQRLLPENPATQEYLEQIFEQQLSLGVITDVVAYTLPLDLEFKRQMLAEWNVDLRAELLLARLRVLADQPPANPFPPDFSVN
jgi:Lon protease-like protein